MDNLGIIVENIVAEGLLLAYSDPSQRCQKGMNFEEKINFSFDVEQEIEANKDELAELKVSNEDEMRVEDLSACIKKNEILLQDLRKDIHRL